MCVYASDAQKFLEPCPYPLSVFRAPAGIELLNLWNDFRKVVEFIDENQWVKPMLERIVNDKNRGMR